METKPDNGKSPSKHKGQVYLRPRLRCHLGKGRKKITQHGVEKERCLKGEERDEGRQEWALWV